MVLGYQFPGARSETAVLMALADLDFRVRIAATMALFELRPDHDPEPVVQALRRAAGRPVSDPYEMPDAQEVFELGLASVLTLPLATIVTPWIDDPDRLRRLSAVRMLADGRVDGARPLLERAAQDPSARVRRVALRGLRAHARAAARRHGTR